MSSTQQTHHRVRSSLPVRAALHALTLALAVTGCAHTNTQAVGSGATQKAVVDFNSCVKPDYPGADLRAGHEGTVHLNFLVDTDGSVADAKVLQSSGYPDMDEAARTAIAKCHFTPAMAQGMPVKDWTKVQYVWVTH